MVHNVHVFVLHSPLIHDVTRIQVTLYVSKDGLELIVIKVRINLLLLRISSRRFSFLSSAICRDNCQHGQCRDQPGQCICYNGWSGENCDVYSERLPCENGGKPVGLKCQCREGYQGLLCEERICLNGGLSSAGKCICPPNYQGEQCEIESKCPICRNKGRCEDKKCVCTKDFIGQYCEIDVRLIQKSEKKIFSMEFTIIFLFVMIFVLIIMVLSCLFYKQKRKQFKQMKEVNLEKIWTVEKCSMDLEKTWNVEKCSTNVFQEKNNSLEKISEKKDINSKLKQIDVQASLV
jgi:hypothetical protein